MRGQALVAGVPLLGADVTLLRGGPKSGTSSVVARGRTNATGRFALYYPAPAATDLLFLVTTGGSLVPAGGQAPRSGRATPAVRGDLIPRANMARPVPAAFQLSSAIGRKRPWSVVVNDLTTGAAGFALAQFVGGGTLAGASPGFDNAAAMAANLVDFRTGGISTLMRRAPNGRLTDTLPTLNTLANIVSRCAVSATVCRRFSQLVAPVNRRPPVSLLQTVASVARNPAHHASGIFGLQGSVDFYRPRLLKAPAAWLLAVKFTGNGRQYNGPGNIAFDAQGNVWATNNYVATRNPADVCAGTKLFRLRPHDDGAPVDGFSGGGIQGAGFGIGIDPRGNIWAGNFGFKGSQCALEPASNSVSKFSPSGVPLSGPLGFTSGGIDWPQGTVSDGGGNIWIASLCGDRVTRYVGGNPAQHTESSGGLRHPFDIVIDRSGNAWVTSISTNRVFGYRPDGTPLQGSPFSGGGLARPLGIATDRQGTQWIANSGVVDLTCPTTGTGTSIRVRAVAQPAGSITRLTAAGHATGFSGGGLTVPWGIATDGDGNVWVANFGGQRVSHFCGSTPTRCPAGVGVGQPISPSTGYPFNGLQRNTGINIDASGNVWLANNWKETPPPANPGGDGLVALVGAASPVRMPLIGPPQRP